MILKTFNHALMITSFVFVMMLIIEYINIQTQGVWHKSLAQSRWKQFFVGGILGIIPGCLGAFTAVALFSHGILRFGAIVTAMIATSGDGAFVMFASIPGKALLINGLLLFIAIVVGVLVDRFGDFDTGQKEMKVHEEEHCVCFPKEKIIPQLKNLTLQRGALISLIAIILGGIIWGKIGPQGWGWKRITFLVVSSISFFIVLTVPEHFLEEHLWDHVVKKHIPQIFIWVFGTLLLLNIVTGYIDVESWIAANQYIVLLIAVLIGIIPQSGPHIIFITLFSQGTLPFSILLANSIVQDGHGMLPMLAESRNDFLKIKTINIFTGLVVGGVGLLIQSIL